MKDRIMIVVGSPKYLLPKTLLTALLVIYSVYMIPLDILTVTEGCYFLILSIVLGNRLQETYGDYKLQKWIGENSEEVGWEEGEDDG
jgi:Mg2+/citrate symporter